METNRPWTQRLQEEAADRRLWPTNAALPDAAAVFVLVRDMPYRRNSAHDLDTILREWCGTCSTKHELLKALYGEMGYLCKMMACTQEIQVPPDVELPAELAACTANGPVIDIHNYLILTMPEGEMKVDATWPLSVGVLGLPINVQFVPGEDMKLACAPLEIFEVPDDISLVDFKDRLLQERFTTDQLEAREQFILGISKYFGLMSGGK